MAESNSTAVSTEKVTALLASKATEWIMSDIKDGKITSSEGKEFISNYRAGLYGYTYLE